MRRKKKDSLGLFQVLLFTTFFYVWSFVDSGPTGTHTLQAQTATLPFRPIGSASAVDRYSQPRRFTEPARDSQWQRDAQPGAYRQPERDSGVRYIETGYRDDMRRTDAYGNVRQVSMQSGGFTLPSGGGSAPLPNEYTPPPLNTPPNLLPGGTQPPAPSGNLQTAPTMTQPQLAPPPTYSGPAYNAPPATENSAPRSLPTPGTGTQSYPSGPVADYQPVAPPQLSNGGFATMSDCRLITPASSYSAMSPYGDTCGGVAPTGYSGTYVAPPAQIAAPAAMPAYPTPPPGALVGSPTAAPVGSLVTFGQETFPVQVGQGLWGQPVAYVPGQRFRNWLRYFSF
ncbi:hypothetical protein FHS27_003926 [Rhodopirellula rubra]|uniref:Uncharacterized protein n=1 Tax=Aporhodopirellula rubra TaxID=980271 RepID=A0A7W5E1K4_9BACT|nr:hypothetical protein [Aporhodopirellula rubra]MBB3208099.1 hypothetical protein [Aporhodopirellula rubra]